LQPIGIDPDTHCVFAQAEHRYRADAIDSQDGVLDFQIGVVGDEQRIARMIRREEVNHHHQIWRALGDSDAELTHFGRQPRLRDRNPVLHLHLCDI
jgi:hypothetical protein